MLRKKIFKLFFNILIVFMYLKQNSTVPVCCLYCSCQFEYMARRQELPKKQKTKDESCNSVSRLHFIFEMHVSAAIGLIFFT